MHNQLVAAMVKNTGAYIRLSKFAENGIHCRSSVRKTLFVSLHRNTRLRLWTWHLYVQIAGVISYISPLIVMHLSCK